jgi:hypothetical protein
VVPVGFIISLVLGILALTRNEPLGKRRARIALLLLLVIFGAGVVTLVGGSVPFLMSTF